MREKALTLRKQGKSIKEIAQEIGVSSSTANGICSIRVENTNYVLHIFGAIQEYGGFNNPDWLF
jgi:hypothetical protein